jgi:hypothetical protein
MNDSDDTQALAAKIRGEGATVAVAPAAAAHDYPEALLTSSEEEEAPTGPMKKRKTTGTRLSRRKKTTRRVSGEQETPSPNTANNLLENQVNDLDKEVETLPGKLATAEESHKLANKSVALLSKQVKLLKEQLKLTQGEEAAQEVVRLKRELATQSDACAKATRFGEELAVEKTTVKQLRLQVSNGTTAYEKVKGKYQQVKKEAKKDEATMKVEISTLKAEADDKAKQLKQDEAKVAAEKQARKTLEHKMKLKLEGEDYKNDKKERELKVKEQLRKKTLQIASSVSSKGFTIPQNEQEYQEIFQPRQQPHQQPPPYGGQPPPYGGHPPPMQQYYQPPMQQYHQPPMQQYPGYQPYPMQPQYQPPMQQYQPPYQPGMSQNYPPPPTMARASSASSVTPTPEEGATYMTEQEMEQGIGSNSLGIPDAEDEEAAAFESTQSSEATPEAPYAA